MGRKKCPHVETLEKQMCAGETPVCPTLGFEGEEQNQKKFYIAPHCAVTSWSEWSPCSVTCGKINVAYLNTFYLRVTLLMKYYCDT